MTIFIRVLLFSLLSSFSALAYTNLGNNVMLTKGSASDTQAAINAASDGYTVQIPTGSFTRSSGVNISGQGVDVAITSGASCIQIGESETNPSNQSHNAVFRILSSATACTVDWTLGGNLQNAAQTLSLNA